MRLVFLFLIFVCLISCNKHDITPDKQTPTSLAEGDCKSVESCVVGSWNWVATSGGVIPDRTPKTEGYTMSLILTSSLTYTTAKNSSITKQGTYRIEKGTDFSYLLFDNDAEGLRIDQRSRNLLLLGDMSADGPLFTYQRAAN